MNIAAFFKVMAREVGILAVFAASAAGWFVWSGRIMPWSYRILSRWMTQDYAYLWNGMDERMASFAFPGAVILACLWPLFLLMRLLRWLRDSGRSVPRLQDRRRSIGQVLVREFLILVLMMVAAAGVFYTARHEAVGLKQRYFSEFIMTSPGYKALSLVEQERARAQYEAVNPGQALDGMLKAYKVRAYAAHYCQLLAFGVLLAGWPLYGAWKLLWWSQRKLRE